ncbi:MAG: SseB family protein, partial [Planktomarina sp.]|nr:SseB family protein [Planktomarina sp.]
MTALERAIVMLENNSDDPVRFAAVLQRLADSELFLALDVDTSGPDLNPKVVYLREQEYVAVYDTELRLEESIGGGVEYLALSGRVLIQML